MKIFCTIFALYVLYLAVYPCQDNDSCGDEQGAQLEMVADLDHDSSEQESCTPFCICSCCAAHIKLNRDADLTFVNLIHNTKLLTPYQEKTSFDNSDAIWQPPKLS